MKKYIFTLALALVALVASAQIKKPELMVIPSDVWCINNGYYTEVENMGITAKVPNYKQALQENMGLKLAIAKLNDLMAERQFPLQSLEQTIKNLEQRRMEDNLTSKTSVRSIPSLISLRRATPTPASPSVRLPEQVLLPLPPTWMCCSKRPSWQTWITS